MCTLVRYLAADQVQVVHVLLGLCELRCLGVKFGRQGKHEKFSSSCNYESTLYSDPSGGVLSISSDRNDRRTFLGLKFFYSGFFLGGRKIWQVFFCVANDLSRDFLGVLKII